MRPSPTSQWYHGGQAHWHFEPHAAAAAADAAAHAAAPTGAASLGTAAGGAGHPPFPPRGSVRWHYHEHPRHLSGRGLARRFFWAGLGAAGATWYFAHKERQRRECERVGQRITTGPAIATSALPAPPTMHAPALASTAPTGHFGQPTMPAPPPSTPVTHELQRQGCWKWGGRHARRHELQASHEREAQLQAQVDALTAAVAVTPGDAKFAAAAPRVASRNNTPAEPVMTSHDQNVERLRDAAKTVWDERAALARDVQARANDKAREVARERLDALAAALDKLRASMADDASRDVKLV